MKKILAMLLALTMSIALVSCGGDADTTSARSDPTAGTDAVVTGGSDWDLAEPGVLTMGTHATFPPYESYDGEDIIGIDADLAAAIADKLGLKLKIVDMDFGSLIGAVETGKVDMCMAGMTANPERAKNVNFSKSYATGIQTVIVAENSDINTVEDLYAMLDADEDLLVGTQEATTGYLYATKSVEDGGFGEEHVVGFQAGAGAVQALMLGKIDCVIIDNEPAKEFVAANRDLRLLDTEYVSEDYAIALPKDNPELEEAVNQALTELLEDGTVQEVLNKYINADRD